MKKNVILLILITQVICVYAQNKSTQQKYPLEKAMDKNISNDPREGKIITKIELDLGMLNYAYGEEIVFNNRNEPNEVELKKALDYLNLSIDNGYETSLVYAERGFCEYFLKLYSKAIVDFTKALELNEYKGYDGFPTKEHYDITDSGFVYRGENGITLWIRPSVAYNLRASSKMQLEDYRGAVSDFTESSKYNSEKDDYQLYLWMGYCKMNLNNFSGAKIDLNKAISISKNVAKAYYYRGFCNINLNLKENACRDWSKAGELGYEQAYKAIQENCNK